MWKKSVIDGQLADTGNHKRQFLNDIFNPSARLLRTYACRYAREILTRSFLNAIYFRDTLGECTE